MESNNKKENHNIQVTPSTSFKINEMNNTTTKRKKKKSKQESGNKSIPLCNCKKSKCLQLYCECFSAEVYCIKDCGCTDCTNQEIYEDLIELVFVRKQVRDDGTTSADARRCKCNKSMCKKKYCECFQIGVNCTMACGCGICHNPFGTREGFNTIAQGSNSDGMTNIEGSAPILFENIPQQQQLRLQILDDSSTFLNNNGSSLNNHTLNSNSTNGNGYSGASSLTPDSTSLYQLLYGGNNNNSHGPPQISLQQPMSENEMVNVYGRQQRVPFPSSNCAPQPCVSMPSNPRPHFNNLLCYQPLTSYVGEGSSSKSTLDLRGGGQDNSASVAPCVNANDSFAQNESNHRNFT